MPYTTNKTTATCVTNQVTRTSTNITVTSLYQHAQPALVSVLLVVPTAGRSPQKLLLRAVRETQRVKQTHSVVRDVPVGRVHMKIW